MPKAKTHDFKGKIYSEIPDEIAKLLNVKAGDELEFRNVYRDLILVTPVGSKAEAPTKERGGLNEEEWRVLKDVNSVRYYERTRENVLKKLDNKDIAIFNSLFSKKVFFDFSKKGQKWVGIAKEFFPLLVKERTKKQASDPMISKLQNQGYLVLSNEAEARMLNDKLKKARLFNSVKGVRGFDKRFYIIMLEKLHEIEGNLLKALEKERVLKDLSKELNISEELCKTAIEVLREDGSVIEKKKELYVST